MPDHDDQRDGGQQRDIAALADGVIGADAAGKGRERVRERQVAEPGLLHDDQQACRCADQGAPGPLGRALADVAVVLQAGNDDQQRDGGPFPMPPAHARCDGNGQQHAQADPRAMDIPRMAIAPMRVARQPEYGEEGSRKFQGARRTDGNRHRRDRCRFWGAPCARRARNGRHLGADVSAWCKIAAKHRVSPRYCTKPAMCQVPAWWHYFCPSASESPWHGRLSGS